MRQVVNVNDKSGTLFNTVISKLSLKNDTELAKVLGLTPPTVSNIRNGRKEVGATLILRAHEVTDIPVAEIRKLLASPPAYV